MKKSFKYISLFSGMGGFDEALNNLGGKCVLASEIDAWANKTYEYLYGHKTVGDVTKVNEKDIEYHDVLVGGFPCQSFSIAGNRLGLKDTRGTLFFEVIRIAKEKKPNIILLENVKGLLSDDQGRTIKVIMKALNEVGYLVDFKIINSSEHGVAQSRERVYIVGVREDLEKHRGWIIRGNTVEGRNKRILARDKELKMFNFKLLSNKRKNKNINDIKEDNVDESFYVKEDKLEQLLESLDKGGFGNKDSVKKRNRPKKLFDKNKDKGEASNLSKVGYIDPEGYDTTNKVYSFEGLAPTLTASCGGETHVLEEGKGVRRVRRLTPLECVRLQAFPDEYYYILKDKGISNTQIYKQTGNAVTVNVIEDIMKSLIYRGYLEKGNKGSQKDRLDG